jgi:hypothetical protein
MENHITFEELTNITSKVREDKKNKYIERIKNGREDAIKHITQNCYEKMAESAKKGYDKAYLYSFQWTPEKDSIYDKNGVKTLFEGNIRLLDLLTKGKTEFINDLNKFFNRDNEKKYHCGFFKQKDNENEIWNIYVSWSSNLEEKEKNNKNQDSKKFNKKIIKNIKKI